MSKQKCNRVQVSQNGAHKIPCNYNLWHPTHFGIFSLSSANSTLISGTDEWGGGGDPTFILDTYSKYVHN
jgi:hypothetical protein